jgi:hypothetical protein
MLARAALGKLGLPFFLSILVTAGCMGSSESHLGAPARPAAVGESVDLAAAENRALEAYGDMPLSFIPNRGQIDSQAAFYAQGAGYGMYFTPGSAILSFTEGGSLDETLPAAPTSGVNLALEFLGSSSDVRLGAEDSGQGTVSYFQGNDPSDWQSGLPTFGEVMYEDLWPGIDLAFRGANGELKYEFILEPGARVDDIRLRYAGADGVSLKPNGGLAIRTALGTLTDSSPVTYQEIEGQRVPVQSRFVLGGGGSYGFDVGPYDRGSSLVIDPGLTYSTYLGGSGTDQGNAVAVDAAGAAYVAGFTSSSNFPTTVGAFDTTYAGGFEAFVTKLSPTGSLVYSTFLGGSGNDIAIRIAVDAAAAIFVTGQTDSASYPTTAGAFDEVFNGNQDAFATKLSPSGALSYSTFLGGSDFDQGSGIAVDAEGAAYVSGPTASSNYPVTASAFDTTHNGSMDTFVTKLDPSGSSPVYSTLFGGSAFDPGSGVAVDAAGAAYVAGFTSSSNFPTTVGTFDTTYNGNFDAFVTRLDPSGSVLLYSTYLGGSGDERGTAVAVDGVGAAYVTGFVGFDLPFNFPTTPGAYDTTFNVGDGDFDAFVTKLAPSGGTLAYSTLLGGGSNDFGHGIAVDSLGAAHITGQTSSADLPTTVGTFDTTYNGNSDAFVTKLDPSGGALAYSTFLGGSAFDEGQGVAVDASGAYVIGPTGSLDFPTTVDAFNTTSNGGAGDAFVTKLDLLASVSEPATVELTPLTATNPVGTQHTVTATVEDAPGNRLSDVMVRFSVTGSVTDSGSCTTDLNGQCDFTYQGPELPGSDTITAFADTDDDGTRDPGEPTGTATKNWVLPASTPGCDVTNAGKITAANGDEGSFSGNAHVSEDGTGVTGQQQYRTKAAPKMTVESIAILAVSCSTDRTKAEIFGTATVDGAGSFDFRIEVEDRGNPGHGNDRYGIRLSNGYDSGLQTLEGGNVRIA